MARSSSLIPLHVFLNGKQVGRLQRDAAGGIAFQYDENWLAWEHTFPISLSLPLREDRYVGAAVMAVFENLLPDNEAIRHMLAARMKVDGKDPYSLLAAIGRDCVGALQFLPEDSVAYAPGQIEGEVLSEEAIIHLLNGLGKAPLGINEDDNFRISLAGAQEKTALLFWKGKWHKPKGTTATTHILKPAIGKLERGIDLSQSVENEHFCMTLLSALGLPTASTQIHYFGDKPVLVVERFDRRFTQDGRLLRLPQEDFCQALAVPSSLKYEADGGPGIVSLLHLLKGSDAREKDQQTLIKAQLAFWLLGATDGHAKNFSIFLKPGSRFQLTPLYDVMSMQPTVSAGRMQHNKMRLAMSVGHSRHYAINAITVRHFIETAAQASLRAPIVTDAVDEVSAMMPGALEITQSQMPDGFPAFVTETITQGILKRLQELTV